MTIQDACKAFLGEARLRSLAHGTVQGYAALPRPLVRRAERNGLSRPDSLLAEMSPLGNGTGLGA